MSIREEIPLPANFGAYLREIASGYSARVRQARRAQIRTDMIEVAQQGGSQLSLCDYACDVADMAWLMACPGIWISRVTHNGRTIQRGLRVCWNDAPSTTPKNANGEYEHEMCDDDETAC